MTTYSARIAESTDDAYDSNDGFPGSVNDGTYLYIKGTGASETMHTGFIHDGVNIPAGATINSCTLQIQRLAFDSAGNESGLTVYMLENATPTTFGTASDSPYDQYTAGTVTTATYSWTMGADGGDNDPEVTGDLSALLQEVVDTVGAVTDLETLVLGTAAGAGEYCYLYSFDNATSGRSALLDIDYTAGAAFDASLMAARHIGDLQPVQMMTQVVAY